jgi:hypothetical protein
VATGDRIHPSPNELLTFCARKDQSADYVRRTADWIKTEYPGSTEALLPRLRKIYRDKKTGHQADIS